MTRGSLAVIVAVTLLVLAAAVLGQDARHVEGPAMPGEHAGAEHGHGDPGMEADVPPEPYVEEEPPRESFVIWFIGALGWRYLLTLPAAALFSFVVVAFLLAKGKGSHLGAAMAFIVAIPFLIGLCALLDNLMAIHMLLAQSTAIPKYQTIASGISVSLVAPIVALILMVPSYLLATVGLTIRAFRGDKA
jgi:hypothetical protein